MMIDKTAEPNRSTDTEQRSWLPLTAISLAMFSVVLDSTMMNVAVGAIAKDLSTSVVGVQSAISLCSLVMASLILTGGKLGDIRGAALIFRVGCVVLGIGSLIAAFSPNLGFLLAGRDGLAEARREVTLGGTTIDSSGSHPRRSWS